jgi:hypothetical protein
LQIEANPVHCPDFSFQRENTGGKIGYLEQIFIRFGNGLFDCIHGLLFPDPALPQKAFQNTMMKRVVVLGRQFFGAVTNIQAGNPSPLKDSG